ncbi:hypothetical protein B0H63DRAFT_456777 [Podospora didyma]|uniref:Uncharacterized protein n=1 Tax=Podospora didyma TaxID=330526 RepID=A0AAE0P3R2_9PEZI|nr:hypothetical protein B0H63DRAFT_456777 [Podospora didyma]
MKPSFQILVFYLLRLAAAMVLPGPRSTSQVTMINYGPEACHSVLTSCHVDTDCCPDLRCKTYDSESFCIPGG